MRVSSGKENRTCANASAPIVVSSDREFVYRAVYQFGTLMSAMAVV